MLKQLQKIGFTNGKAENLYFFVSDSASCILSDRRRHLNGQPKKRENNKCNNDKVEMYMRKEERHDLSLLIIFYGLFLVGFFIKRYY